MSAKYRTVVTTAGAVKLAAAAVPGGKKVNLTVMAVGDGGGSLPEPNASQTKLVNEVWRHALNKISQDNKKKNYIVAELVIPPEVGSFWARELGLYDDAGTLIAVANMAESYKPELAEGSGRAQTCRMVIILSSIESVELSIDTTTVMATQDYVDDKITAHEQSRRHPDATLKEKGFVQLSSATDSTSEALAATPGAVKAVYDLANAKYTAQDATTARKGIVQLSSATNSTSEVLAATPKAVKAAYDLADGKYTAQDATTARKGIVQLSSATDSTSEALAATPGAVKAVYDLANAKYTAQDATTARKGIVQLSSATNSTSEVLAATPKAVKAAYDLADGKYTAQDATTARKGIVQLSNATDSTSEVLAATPKAVKAANDNANGRVPSTRKVNKKELSGDITLSANDVGALSVGGGKLAGSLEIESTAPLIQFTETDTGKKYYIIIDGSGFRINQDTPSGVNGIFSFDPTTKDWSLAGGVIPKKYDNFYSLFQKINKASLGTNGWFEDANTGLIIQYGIGGAAGVAKNYPIQFPIAFPNRCINLQTTLQSTTWDVNSGSAMGQIIDNTLAYCWSTHSFFWFAIGR
ncbi:tail fiber protein [Citrobacter freundii]|uniref:tail fiber protein n=1 Tax=Citrobacter freundii TaxID=546 RepID=UPI0039794496